MLSSLVYVYYSARMSFHSLMDSLRLVNFASAYLVVCCFTWLDCNYIDFFRLVFISSFSISVFLYSFQPTVQVTNCSVLAINCYLNAKYIATILFPFTMNAANVMHVCYGHVLGMCLCALFSFGHRFVSSAMQVKMHNFGVSSLHHSAFTFFAIETE